MRARTTRFQNHRHKNQRFELNLQPPAVILTIFLWVGETIVIDDGFIDQKKMVVLIKNG